MFLLDKIDAKRRQFIQTSAFLAFAVFGINGCSGGGGGFSSAPSSSNMNSPGGTNAMNNASPAQSAAVGIGTGGVNQKTADNFTTQLLIPSSSGGVLGIFSPSSKFAITASSAQLAVISGKTASLETYNVSSNGVSYVNPTIKIRTNNTIASKLTNNLTNGQNTIIHWHGITPIDYLQDGSPDYEIATNKSYDYSFAVPNRSGLYWYHSHAMSHTAEQAYKGLAGLILVEDADSDTLKNALSLNESCDIPIVIQDKVFDPNGAFSYAPSTMDNLMGYFGDTVLCNLTIKPKLDVSADIYRFRILNGSNARTYRLAFVDASGVQTPFTLIGTDGGLLDRPYIVTELFVSPAERVDVLFDFSKYALNSQIYLKSLAFNAMDSDVMGSGMSTQTSSLANGDEFYIMKCNILTKTSRSTTMPTTLSALSAPNMSGATARNINITSSMGGFLINGFSYQMGQYPIQVSRNTKEIWSIVNTSTMPHPMHIHGAQYRVIGRTGSPYQISRLSVDANGRIATDMGVKDTVMVWPNETVNVLIDFTLPNSFSSPQNYLFHCHILEHEDNGMMINYKVT